MSLTGELANKESPVTLWFKEWLPDTKPVSKDWNERVKAVPVRRPQTDLRVPGTVGTAFDYRLRYHLAVAPLEQLVAGTGLRLLDVPRNRTSTARSAPDAFLALYGAPPAEAAPVSALIDEFKDGLTTTLSRLNPVGRALADSDEEVLCRYCYVLGLLEELYRAGLQISSPLYRLQRGATLTDLLALPPQIWADDLCALSQACRPNLPELSRSPLYLNPMFEGSAAIGGADADLIAGGCLIDVKTTVDPKFSSTRLLYQLLGYVFLDYDNEYRVGAVAIYLSRQGLLIRWDLEELLATLGDSETVPLIELRQTFRHAVAEARVNPALGVADRAEKQS
jgi:hypothetical protein